jgi:hypothetical protein
VDGAEHQAQEREPASSPEEELRAALGTLEAAAATLRGAELRRLAGRVALVYGRALWRLRKAERLALRETLERARTT